MHVTNMVVAAAAVVVVIPGNKLSTVMLWQYKYGYYASARIHFYSGNARYSYK